MKSKNDFIGILERAMKQPPGRFFIGDNSCTVPDRENMEIWPRAVFDLPLSGEKRVRFAFHGAVREESLRPGDLLFSPAGCWKCTLWDLPHELSCFIIDDEYLRYTYVDYRQLDEQFRRPVCRDFFHTGAKPPALLRQLLHLLTETATGFPENPSGMLLARAVLNLGLELLRKDHPSPAAGKAERTFQQLMQFLRENYMVNVTRREAARQFLLNECYVSRLFQKRCGKSFTEMLRELRMDHAAFLLTHTHLLVDEIADQCGYASTQTFTTVFRRYSGMPPARYRAAHFKEMKP